MHGKILYSGCTTLPSLRGHFLRPRIDELLGGLLERHLIAVSAGAGSGKTHAISSFLQNAGVRVFWLQLSEIDNNLTRFWEEFLYILEFQNKATAARLERLGFPETLLKFDRFLHIFAEEIYSSEQVVLVFDDFHLIHEQSILRFVQNLILARLENFCVIINTRSGLSLNLSGLFAGGLAAQITSEDLYFTRDETEEYLRLQGITLAEREVNKVQAFTQGWPLALYLVGLSIKHGGMVSNDPIAGAAPLIFEMLETELFSAYEPRIQNFLIRASLLNSFPEGLVKALAGDDVNAVLDFLQDNMFVYGNQYTAHYSFHHLFLEFLSGKQKCLSQRERDETYLMAAGWCAANDLKIEALVYYDKCGHYAEILDTITNFGVAIFSKTTAELYISLIDRFPAELIQNNPLLHVHRAGLLCNNAEVSSAIDELLRTRDILEAMPPTRERTSVLGEIYCMLGLISLGMADYGFITHFEKAAKFLPNGSVMIDSNGTAVNTRHAIMLKSPEPGQLKKMEDALFYAMPYASKVMRGYGQGMEYLASAEAAYFTGDMKKAEKNAYEAVYRAAEKRVADIVSGGYFLLMRVGAANGNYEGVVTNLERMRAYVEGIENKWNFNGMPDVAEGWFNLMFGDTERVAGWLLDEALGSSVLAPYSMGMERSVKARYLLREGRYYELLAWIGQSEKPIRQHGIWLILLDILICKAIALHHIHDERDSLEALREAYQIAHGNGLIMQFVELGRDIRSLIYSARRSAVETAPAQWLDEIYTKAATYEKHLRAMRSERLQALDKTSKPLPKLTKRERETLKYLCRGLTNAEIASASFITISAVKKTLNNIYIKLSATNRADAVRSAIQMGLDK